MQTIEMIDLGLRIITSMEDSEKRENVSEYEVRLCNITKDFVLLSRL